MFEIEKGLEPDITLVYKLTKDGQIKFINKAFTDITGFTEKDLINENHVIIQHPKMPKIIIDLSWEAIHNGQHTYSISKNITKNGEYFWTIADIHSRKSDKLSTSVFIRKKFLPTNIKEEFEKLYEVLYRIENSGGGTKIARKYLDGWLEDRDADYNSYIINSFGGEKNLKDYLTTEVSDEELFSTDPVDMNIDDILKFVKQKKKRRFW